MALIHFTLSFLLAMFFGVTFSKNKSAASLSRSKSKIQLGQKPSATGRRRPGKRATWNCVNVSPCACKYFTAVMTLLLFTGAVVMVILYFHKQKKTTMEKSSAMTVIREFMILQNESFKGKNDSEILDGVQPLVHYLSQLQSRNDQIERANRVIIAKLVQGWKPFLGNLYYLSKSALPVKPAGDTCIRQGGHLVDITNHKEEKFLEDEVAKDATKNGVAGRDDVFYIGLINDGSGWKWVTGEPLTTSYWEDKVAGAVENPCAVIFICRTKKGKCWKDVSCDIFRRYICKVKPNPKYL